MSKKEICPDCKKEVEYGCWYLIRKGKKKVWVCEDCYEKGLEDMASGRIPNPSV